MKSAHDILLDNIGDLLDGQETNIVMPVLAYLTTLVAVDSGNGKEHFLGYMSQIADTLFDEPATTLQ
jgi:hypothetical protein